VFDSTVSSGGGGGGGGNEMYDISSSPTSSVSSSKVELTTYFDNDSGVGGSNPLDMTPTTEPQQTQYNDQPPYLETNLETQSWYQTRSAYSAPSSPALPRNADHLHRSRGSSPRSSVIRSHPSMDGINSRPWPKSSKIGVEDTSWNISAFRHPGNVNEHGDVIRSPDNHDSGLSSPRTLLNNNDPRHSKDRPQHTKVEENLKTDVVQNTPISKSWSVERFQDVRTLADLLKQLSLDKYTTKLEVGVRVISCYHDVIFVIFYTMCICSYFENLCNFLFQQSGISLDNIIHLTERDLQAYEVPKVYMFICFLLTNCFIKKDIIKFVIILKSI